MKYKMRISLYYNSVKFEFCLRVIGFKFYVIFGKNWNCNKVKMKVFCKIECFNKRVR